MVNRIELAKRFVETQCQARNDLVGAFLIGSAARGEDGEFSDIDVALVVAGDIPPNSRGDAATWQDGIFIDATIRAQRYYADVEEVLRDAFRSTHMNDASFSMIPRACSRKSSKQCGRYLCSPTGWGDGCVIGSRLPARR
jgi:predicted nucleotidyltransferase